VEGALRPPPALGAAAEEEEESEDGGEVAALDPALLARSYMPRGQARMAALQSVLDSLASPPHPAGVAQRDFPIANVRLARRR